MKLLDAALQWVAPDYLLVRTLLFNQRGVATSRGMPRQVSLLFLKSFNGLLNYASFAHEFFWKGGENQQNLPPLYLDRVSSKSHSTVTCCIIKCKGKFFLEMTFSKKVKMDSFKKR